MYCEEEGYEVGGERSTSQLVIRSFTRSRTNSDDSPYPLYGWSSLGRLSGSAESLGSDVTFTQVYGRARYIQKVGTGRILLGAEGAATEVSDFDLLPVSQRFFAGRAEERRVGKERRSGWSRN